MNSALAHTLDAAQLADTLRAGIYRLFARSDHINKINVFPVPDGDTGTNLSMTLVAVLGVLDRGAPIHAGQLLVRVADAALDGARGNSGAILAQFLLGLGDRLGPLDRIGARDFALAAGAGAAYAREALTQPREGTLLTVLSDFASALERLTEQAPAIDLPRLFAAAMEPLRRSLAGTLGALEETRAAGVVDAGAQGFVDLVEGMSDFLESGELRRVTAPLHGEEEGMAASGPGDTRYRYCTECLVSGPALEPRRVRESLVPFGSSLVVGGTRSKLRIHIHTNDPERLFEFVSRFGTVSGQKVDDMRAQQTAAHHARARGVAIVVDSAADLPEALLESLEMHVVPLRVHFGGQSYLDKVTLTPEEFYRELERQSEPPKTSQPPPGDFRRLYEFLASHYESVVSISLSSRVSGTYDAAVGAAQRIAGNRVRVVDSASVSLGQGLLAIRAAELAQRGASAAEVEQGAVAARARIRTFAITATLDYAVRGGRIPPAARTLSKLLHLSPVLHTTPDGHVRPCGAIWGRGQRRRRFARFIARRLERGATYRVLVGHGNTVDAAHELLHELRSAIEADGGTLELAEVLTLGTALGVHGGPGMLVVGVERCLPPGVIGLADPAARVS